MPSLTSTLRWLSGSSERANPHAAELAKLQEQLQRQEKRLRESALLGWPELPGTLAIRDNSLPFDQGGYGDFAGLTPFAMDRTANRTHSPLPLITEAEWRYGIAASQDLCTRNHLAIAFKDFVSNFVGPCQVQFVLRSQSPAPVSSGPVDADSDGMPDTDPLIAACQQVWDEWAELNDWGQGEEDREAECRDRLFRHGEAILRFFQGEYGQLPVCRHVEPEIIRSPVGVDPNDSWGIRTAPNDVESVKALYISDPDNPGNGQWTDAAKFVRLKANVDRNIKRGLPDLFPVAAHLRRVVGLLENMGEVARLQAAIAWIQKYGPLVSQEQVRAAITQGSDYSAVTFPGMPGATSRTLPVKEYPAGAIIGAENGREFEPGPMSTGVPGFVQVEQTILRGVGLRWGCPQFFSSDGGDSFASSLVTGSPFARATEARQERMKGFTRSVAKKVLELAEASGRLPRGAARKVKVLVTCKPVVFADEEKQARVFETELKNKVLDPQEWIKKRGRDPKVVAANIAAWEEKFGPVGQGDEGGSYSTKQVMDRNGNMRVVRVKRDQPPEGGFGAGMTPAPPGSAGGDGSSPLGESVGRVTESAPGPPPRPGLVWKDSTHRWVNPDTGKNAGSKEKDTAEAPPAKPEQMTRDKFAAEHGSKNEKFDEASAIALTEPNTTHSELVHGHEKLLEEVPNFFQKTWPNGRTDKFVLRKYEGRDGRIRYLAHATSKDGSKVYDRPSAGMQIEMQPDGTPKLLTVANDEAGSGLGKALIMELEKDYSDWVPSYPMSQQGAKLVHRMKVEQALRQGKPVSAEVLKDYPDLVAKFSKQESRATEDRSGLTRKTVTVHGKSGDYQSTRLVSTNSDSDSASTDTAPESPIPAEHVTAGLAEKIAAIDPEAAKQPGLIAKLQDKALTVAAKVYGAMVNATPAALKVISVLEGVFDTPEDMKKLGYNPTMSSGIDHAAPVHDPVRDQLGISTHLASTIASHVLARVVVWVKGKMSTTPESAGIEEAAATLAEMLKAAAAELGLSEPPDAAALAESLRNLIGG